MTLTKDEIREMVYFNSVYGKGPIKDLCKDIIDDGDFPWDFDAHGQILYLEEQAKLNPHIKSGLSDLKRMLDPEEEYSDIQIPKNTPVRIEIVINR